MAEGAGEAALYMAEGAGDVVLYMVEGAGEDALHKTEGAGEVGRKKAEGAGETDRCNVVGAGEEALYMSPGEGALLGEARGRGEGRRNVESSLSGDAGVFLSEPGGFAVFMLEYGLNFFFGDLSSGVLPRELQPSSRYPNSL